MSVRVFQYAKCSTCRKALKWLEMKGVAFESLPIVEKPPSAATLRELQKRSGKPVAKFFNTSGESYREGNFKEKLAGMSEAECFAALAKDGKLIKRPLIDTGKAVLVGFNEAEYKVTFSAKK